LLPLVAVAEVVEKLTLLTLAVLVVTPLEETARAGLTERLAMAVMLVVLAEAAVEVVAAEITPERQEEMAVQRELWFTSNDRSNKQKL
jgi:hypothetical protein